MRIRDTAVIARLASLPLVWLTWACSPPAPEPEAAPVTAVVFENARLISGTDEAPIETSTFIVDGGRFVEVGRAGEVQIPEGAKRVDLSGKTVMPAIVDTHVHLSQEREALIEDLRRRAYWGVSAAMSLGLDQGEVPFQVRGETLTDAAIYRTAGRGITRPEPGRSDVPYWVNSEAEARTAVQEQAALKVDIVKIWVDDRDGKYEKMTPALYGAVIDEAHKNGLRVTAHIFTLDDAKGLVRAGVDAFAHSVRDRDVDDEFVALMKVHPNVVLVPNLPDRGVAVDMGWLSEALPAGEVEKLQTAATDRPDAQTSFGIQARNLARLSASGVPIALGTDGNAAWAPHVEMADMVASGMTTAQVIVASTGRAAEFMRLTDTGTVKEGKSADFLVLEGNPLDDITNTRRISAVYLGGAEVNRAAIRDRWLASAAASE
jgi:imidazolonepropionase-like amidohydrolase